MNKVIFDYIKSWVINFHRLTQSNQFGYVDDKIRSINKIKNDDEYSAMLVLNTLHVLSRRHILNHKSTPIYVIDYVTKHSDDLKTYFLLEADDKLIKSLERHKKINKVLNG